MNEPRIPPQDRHDDDPRRRLGLTESPGDEDPAVTRRKVLKDRLAIAGAILMFAITANALTGLRRKPVPVL